MVDYNFKEIRPMMQIVANELKEIEFDSVLEIGCGCGENLAAIERTFKDKKIMGVDVNLERLDIARKNTNVELYWADINDLEIADKSFDVVFTNALFCMLRPEEIEHGIKEMVRIAKKYLILIELNSPMRFGKTGADRTGADWKQLFKELGSEAKLKKIPADVWGVSPWLRDGYIITVKL